MAAEGRRMTIGEISQVLERIQCRGYRLALGVDGSDRPFLQVHLRAPDSTSPAGPREWSGRKWQLSLHMTTSEIVRTALKAVLTASEHEVRETFTYRGEAIFGPHFDVEQLVALCQEGDTVLEVRSPRPNSGD
jgi:hypothetical protein